MLEQTQLFARMGDSAEASAVRQRLQARALQSDMAAFKVVRAVCCDAQPCGDHLPLLLRRRQTPGPRLLISSGGIPQEIGFRSSRETARRIVIRKAPCLSTGTDSPRGVWAPVCEALTTLGGLRGNKHSLARHVTNHRCSTPPRRRSVC